MFVFVHYIAGVYLDFSPERFHISKQEKKKKSQIQIAVFLYGMDHLAKLAGLFVFGKDP